MCTSTIHLRMKGHKRAHKQPIVIGKPINSRSLISQSRKVGETKVRTDVSEYETKDNTFVPRKQTPSIQVRDTQAKVILQAIRLDEEVLFDFVCEHLGIHKIYREYHKIADVEVTYHVKQMGKVVERLVGKVIQSKDSLVNPINNDSRVSSINHFKFYQDDDGRLLTMDDIETVYVNIHAKTGDVIRTGGSRFFPNDVFNLYNRLKSEKAISYKTVDGVINHFTEVPKPVCVRGDIVSFDYKKFIKHLTLSNWGSYDENLGEFKSSIKVVVRSSRYNEERVITHTSKDNTYKQSHANMRKVLETEFNIREDHASDSGVILLREGTIMRVWFNSNGEPRYSTHRRIFSTDDSRYGEESITFKNMLKDCIRSTLQGKCSNNDTLDELMVKVLGINQPGMCHVLYIVHSHNQIINPAEVIGDPARSANELSSMRVYYVCRYIENESHMVYDHSNYKVNLPRQKRYSKDELGAIFKNDESIDQYSLLVTTAGVDADVKYISQSRDRYLKIKSNIGVEQRWYQLLGDYNKQQILKTITPFYLKSKVENLDKSYSRKIEDLVGDLTLGFSIFAAKFPLTHKTASIHKLKDLIPRLLVNHQIHKLVINGLNKLISNSSKNESHDHLVAMKMSEQVVSLKNLKGNLERLFVKLNSKQPKSLPVDTKVFKNVDVNRKQLGTKEDHISLNSLFDSICEEDRSLMKNITKKVVDLKADGEWVEKRNTTLSRYVPEITADLIYKAIKDISVVPIVLIENKVLCTSDTESNDSGELSDTNELSGLNESSDINGLSDSGELDNEIDQSDTYSDTLYHYMTKFEIGEDPRPSTGDLKVSAVIDPNVGDLKVKYPKLYALFELLPRSLINVSVIIKDLQRLYPSTSDTYKKLQDAMKTCARLFNEIKQAAGESDGRLSGGRFFITYDNTLKTHMTDDDEQLLEWAFSIYKETYRTLPPPKNTYLALTYSPKTLIKACMDFHYSPDGDCNGFLLANGEVINKIIPSFTYTKIKDAYEEILS